MRSRNIVVKVHRRFFFMIPPTRKLLFLPYSNPEWLRGSVATTE
jgi:hypothetical protein